MSQIRAAVPVNVMDSHCITCPWYGVKLSKTKSALFSLFAGDAVRDDNVGVPYAFHDALGGAREPPANLGSRLRVGSSRVIRHVIKSQAQAVDASVIRIQLPGVAPKEKRKQTLVLPERPG